MPRFLFIGALIGITVYAFFDALRTPSDETQVFPRWLWLIFILLGFGLGGLLWLVFGRARKPRGTGTNRRKRGPIAPDDDPAFLKKLDEDAWRARMQQRRERSGEDEPEKS